MKIEHKELYIKTLEEKVSELEMDKDVNKRLKMIKAYFLRNDDVILSNSDVMKKLMIHSQMWKIRKPELENISEIKSSEELI